MSEKLNPLESNPAYICGELLDVFDQIQREPPWGKLKQPLSTSTTAASAAP